MIITQPILSPKKGYIEVELNGQRTYCNISTGLTIEEEQSFSEQQKKKELEISLECNQVITSGIDVETTVGIEHFSLEETDQINLTNAISAIAQGATMYPYHANGQLCRMFSAEELQDIVQASTEFIVYHTTLCNHLLTWVRRVTTIEELQQITYSIDNLPEDLALNMQNVLTASASI